MRGIGSKLVVAAVAAIAVAATADALRSRGNASPAPDRKEPELPAEAARELRANHVAGRLVLADANCRVRALSLPDLRPAQAPPLRCAAFVPFGRLGLRNGEAAWFGVGDGHTIVLDRGALADTLARDDPDFDRAGARLRRVAFLGGRRYAGVVANGRGDELVALFEGREIFWSSRSTGIDWLRASPRGSYVGIHHRNGRLLVLDRNARPVPAPRTLTQVRAVAWGPDERWTAIATRRSVFVMRTGARWPLVRLPLAVRDLGWRE